MTGRSLAELLALLLGIALPMRPGDAPPRESGASLPGCYRAHYDQPKNEIDSTLLPPMVQLMPGSDSGVVYTSASPADSLGFWRMFMGPARWVRIRADSAQLNFSNGFSNVVFDLVVRPDILEGRARIHYDVLGAPVPEMHVVLSRIGSCLTRRCCWRRGVGKRPARFARGPQLL